MARPGAPGARRRLSRVHSVARRALGPATLRAVQAVHAALTPDDHTLLVACSGGPDSLALAVAVRHAASRLGRHHAAVVVDHGLQPTSAAVATRTVAQLKGLGYLDVERSRAAVNTSARNGPEAAARTARYTALAERATELDAAILLGHTLDDQAESVLLGLVRGSGLRSLAGMAGRRGRLVRPFLDLPRAVTAAVCTESGLEPWRDPHNDDPAYTRSRIRSRVLPLLEAELGPGVAEALARTARLARLDADLLDDLAEAASANRTSDPGPERADLSERAEGADRAGLDCRWLADVPAALRGRVLRRWLQARGARDLTADQVAAVDELVTNWHGQRRVEVRGLRVRRVGARLEPTEPHVP